MMYALLDYDGFVCKAYYSTIARQSDDIEKMFDVLDELTTAAKQKAELLSTDGKVQVIKYMSSHTFKKDLYPSYKQGRKRDERLGVFRDLVKEEFKMQLHIDELLEADDLIIADYEYYTNAKQECMVFSDDKDLRYYCPKYCKINFLETPELEEDSEKEIFIQMLAGDREDNIKGVPNIGKVKAKKILDKEGYSLESVIKVYKENNVDIDSCMRDIMLVLPLCRRFTDNYVRPVRNNRDQTLENIYSRITYLNRAIKGVYNNDELN